MRVDSRKAVVEESQPQAGQQWEYRTRSMDVDADLTQWGQDGWECFAVIPLSYDPTQAVYHFRRRK